MFTKKNKLVPYVLYGVLFSYFSVIIINLISYSVANYFNYREIPYKYEKYIIPFFKQGWDMYGNPPQSNTEIYYRTKEYHNGIDSLSNWKKIIRPLLLQKRDNLAVGTTVADFTYMLWHCGNNIAIKIGECYGLGEEPNPSLLEECYQKYYPGDTIIMNYLNRFLIDEVKGIDSLEVEYKVVFEEIPKYRQADSSTEYIVFTRTPYKIIKP